MAHLVLWAIKMMVKMFVAFVISEYHSIGWAKEFVDVISREILQSRVLDIEPESTTRVQYGHSEIEVLIIPGSDLLLCRSFPSLHVHYAIDLEMPERGAPEPAISKLPAFSSWHEHNTPPTVQRFDIIDCSSWATVRCLLARFWRYAHHFTPFFESKTSYGDHGI